MRKVKGTYQIYHEPVYKHGTAGNIPTREMIEPGKWETVEFTDGLFHRWGVQSDELDVGALVNTVAIVELPDGRIVTSAPTDIVFMDKEGEDGT